MHASIMQIIRAMPELDPRAHFQVIALPSSSPLATRSRPNDCAIAINENWAAWLLGVFPIAPDVDIETKVRTMVYHESYHCQFTDNPNRAHPSEERAADRHALQMMQKHYPQDFEKAVHFMRESRRLLPDYDGSGLHSAVDDIDAFAQQLRDNSRPETPLL